MLGTLEVQLMIHERLQILGAYALGLPEARGSLLLPDVPPEDIVVV